jgi:diguanylate cyclase (GGDEF)-like protein
MILKGPAHIEECSGMNSIRTKTTLLFVCVLIVVMTIITLLGVAAIRNIGNSSSEQMLFLLCESGQKDLNSYFESVEQSVEMVSAYVAADLEGLKEDQLAQHLTRVRDIFARLAYRTNGVLTYYYRIDPAISETEKGFWYVNLDGNGFEEHEPTDITLYDTDNTSALVWFTVPRATGTSIWLPPYITDNLDVRVISYNVPVYWNERFIGVIGIEIDYSTMAEQVDHITLYENGYAFINDAEGSLIYHPHIDVASLTEPLTVPDGLLTDHRDIRYTFEGVEKQAVCLPLSNGMRLNVSVPVSEINALWQRWINQIFVISVALIVIAVFITMRFTGRITKPLHELTEVAERINDGDYDSHLEYSGDDEVGILTSAVNKLTAHLKTYITDLNNLAYADALTSVHNKGAFDLYVAKMQTEMEASGNKPEFAVCIFDCNELKAVNDQNGHDKGDIYIKATCALICEVFDHSPVFRIGGDEFAVVLQNADYEKREELLQRFDETELEWRTEADVSWEQVDVARGMAIYDPETDESVNDVVRRADKLMYEDKWQGKQGK